MNPLRKLWWGLYSLPAALWGFYVFGNFVAFFIPIILGSLLITKLPELRSIKYITTPCISWTYWAAASVGTWRSADTYKGSVRFWSTTAKIIVGLFALTFLYRLINGGALTLISKTMGNWN